VLRTNLYVPNRSIRRNSIYTFGKLSFFENARLLDEALPFYLEHDPLEIDGLLFELFWLSREARRRHWSYLRRITTAPSYLTRWAGLNIAIWRFGDAYDRGLVTLERTFARLAADPHEAVRDEAAFCLDQFQQQLRMETPPEHGHNELLKRHLSHGPEVNFGRIDLTFGNYLHRVGLDDYEPALLDEWVRCWQDRPFSTVKVSRGSDRPAAYTNRFHRWRRQQGPTIVNP
jgi:hypothetical protein